MLEPGQPASVEDQPIHIDHSWGQGPTQPLLGAAAVDVWRADLAQAPDALEELLCAEEHERAACIHNEHKRRLWIRSRGVLRDLLGRYLEQDPCSLRFVIGAHGKPTLRDSRLSFNLSHSGGLGLYAFSDTGALGVDVERARRPIDEVAIARSALGLDEAQRLQTLEPAIRQREFLRMWARHEAVLKCRGSGIGGATEDGAVERPWLVDLEVGPGAAGALAGAGSAREVRCSQWRGG
jgi:4'-phosphopantetheinyl transferase